MDKKQILLDVDGVLANFVQGSIDFHGMNSEFKWEDATDWTYYKKSPWSLTSREFFLPLDTVEFWENLKPYEYAVPFYRFLKTLGAELTICTAVPDGSVNAASGKYRWLKKHLGIDSSDVVITRKKHLLANDHTLLIDDAMHNAIGFRNNGGNVILFPRPWNGATYRNWRDIALSAEEWVEGELAWQR